MAERRTVRPALVAGSLLGAVAATMALTAPAHAEPVVDHELPFPCGQDWHGSTRSGHSPSWYSIDWNAPDDLGKPMLTSAAGVVTRVEDLGSRSYGLYAIVDHGEGETSLYAHLQAEYVTVGQRLDQGELLGRLGESGGVSGAHLHYEQRADGRGVHPWFHDTAFEFNTTQRSRSCVDTPVAGDWDGDGTDEVGVFRRGRRGSFRLDAGTDVRRARWGSSVDQPVVADWDGDGADDLGVRRPFTGAFLRQGENGPLPRLTFGRRTDRALSGDWDGDGQGDVGAWRPAGARFLMRTSDGSVRRVQLGSSGALPVTGDWNGDGRTDVGTFSAGSWSLRLTRADGTTWSGTRTFGRPGDLPVAGDWNGDGADELGVWRPATAVFALRHSGPMAARATSVRTQRFGRPR